MPGVATVSYSQPDCEAEYRQSRHDETHGRPGADLLLPETGFVLHVLAERRFEKGSELLTGIPSDAVRYDRQPSHGHRYVPQEVLIIFHCRVYALAISTGEA